MARRRPLSQPFAQAGITRRISTVPPHQEIVRVGRPAWLLVPIQRLQLPQDFGSASAISVHTLRHSIAWGIIHSIQRLRATARQAGSQERFTRSNSLLRFLVLAAQLAPVNMAERALPGRMERC